MRSGDQSLQEKVTELKRELHAAEIKLATEEVVKDFYKISTMNHVTSQGKNAETILGPTVIAMLGVNEVNTEALIDTGLPVTIISLSFAMQVLRNDLQSYSSIEEWKQETMKIFSEPTVSLRNYGGHRLEITSQAQFSFSQGGNKERANVLVQKDAPHQVLLGTDLQPKLGI